MNVARRPWLRAISRTTDLKTTVSSQAVIAIAVAEVDLDLRGAVLGVGGLDDDAVGLDHAADVPDDVLQLGALLQRVALDAVVDRLAVLVGEVELDLGRQHGLEAACAWQRSTCRRSWWRGSASIGSCPCSLTQSAMQSAVRSRHGVGLSVARSGTTIMSTMSEAGL